MQYDNKTNLEQFFLRIQRRHLLAECHRLCKIGLSTAKGEECDYVYGAKFRKETWIIEEDEAKTRSIFKRDYWDVKTKKRMFPVLICFHAFMYGPKNSSATASRCIFRHFASRPIGSKTFELYYKWIFQKSIRLKKWS